MVLDSGALEARIGPGEVVESLVYAGREYLEWGNRLELHLDGPPEWDARDVER